MRFTHVSQIYFAYEYGPNYIHLPIKTQSILCCLQDLAMRNCASVNGSILLGRHPEGASVGRMGPPVLAF